MASNSKKSGKDNETGDEEDLWFDAARKLGKDQDDMPDYNFKDDNRRTFAIVGSIFAIFLFGGILWYLYYQKNLGAEGEVPLIAADHEPVKTRPADPGGFRRVKLPSLGRCSAGLPCSTRRARFPSPR